MLSNTATPVHYKNFRDAVLRGEIPVCKEISMQMNRIDKKIADKRYFYDDEAINGWVKFCEAEMTLTDGSELLLTECFKVWGEDLLAWFYYEERIDYNPHTRRKERFYVKKRLCNKQLIIDARGSAKSMYASLMQAYGVSIITTTTSQITVAPTMKQSEEILSPIRTALARSRGPYYKFMTMGSASSTGANKQNRPKLMSTKKGIENSLTNSILEVRPMSIDKLQGLRPWMSTIDEWLSGDNKEDVIGAIEQGASKMEDYIIIATSSEGTTRDGVGDELKMEMQTILRGDYEADNVSIFHYKLDDVSEVADPAMWMKANSNLGTTISYTAYYRDVERMKANPSIMNDVLAKRFGIPVAGRTFFFTYEETRLHRRQNLKGAEIALGGDMSQGDDFCSFGAFIPMGHSRFGYHTINFVTQSKVDRLPDAMYKKYQEFIAEGSLIVMPGSVLKMDSVYDELDNWISMNNYMPRAFGYDPYNSDTIVKNYVSQYGEYGVEKVIQGARTESVPMGDMKNLARDRNLIFWQKIVSWSMGNAIAEIDNNKNYKLSKKRSSEKIDPVAAMLDAYIAYTRNMEVFN